LIKLLITRAVLQQSVPAITIPDAPSGYSDTLGKAILDTEQPRYVAAADMDDPKI
jgi:hypothetical protein